MIKILALSVFAAVFPFFLYVGGRPPKGLKPNLRAYGPTLQRIGESWTVPLLAISGAFLGISAFTFQIGKEDIAAVVLIISLPMVLCVAILSAICFSQQIGGRSD